MTTVNRDQEIQSIHLKYADFYRIGGGIGLILIGIWLGSLFFSDGYRTNVYTEFLSVAATIAVIDQLNRRRARKERQVALFRQAKSRLRDMASEALDQIKDDGLWDALLDYYRDNEGQVDLSSVGWDWMMLDKINLKQVNLKRANLEQAYLVKTNLQQANLNSAHMDKADLQYANLKGANLISVSLQHADLRHANLEQASLYRALLRSSTLTSANLQAAYLEQTILERAELEEANLQDANLSWASLEQASLFRANLEQANLQYARLQEADLWEANLHGTNLMSANLQGAFLRAANLRGVEGIETARFDEKTVLPDAESIRDENDHFMQDDAGNFIWDKYWTPETDMTRYTDPNHPDFWEPDWVKAQREQGD